MNLVDKYGRRIRKLRISLTDKCNLRCHYCMPLDATFINEHNYLSAAGILEIARELFGFGLEEIRLTGGEPLLRKGFNDIALGLAEIPFRKRGLTTNGVMLSKHLPLLKDAEFNHLNISLDSLREDRFQKISRGRNLKTVIAAIEQASLMGFQVKINAVAMKGINDDEFFDFVQFAKNNNCEIRFLELMKIGHARSSQEQQFISAQEILTILQQQMRLEPMVTTADSTSFNYLNEHKVKIGFIASETQAFCGSCSRWRLSAEGILRGCLFKDEGIDLKGQSSEQRLKTYAEVLKMKPYTRPESVAHQMNSIGG
ncbi:MAG: GTP 3',8-cyclase MoaA [Bdellovibrio sp.]